MPFEKVEFEFPDPDKQEEKEKEPVESKEPEAKEEKDIEVEVVDDTPPKDRGRQPSEPPADVTEDELADYSEKVRKRIQHFSKGYHDERRRAEAAAREKEEAIRLAQHLLQENEKLKQETTKSQTALLEQAKARVNLDLEAAKRAYKEAYESGDSDKLVQAQVALNAAQNKVERVANFKPALQTPKTQVKPEPVAPASAPDPKASAWQKANPWFGSDDEMTSLALGLHQRLVREGVDPQSEEYYERINTRMRQVFPDQFEPEEKPPEKQRRSSVVAPASRSTAPKKIVLTESAVKLAKRLGLTPEQYARQVAEEMRKQNG
jgi:hypothetical protein